MLGETHTAMVTILDDGIKTQLSFNKLPYPSVISAE